MQKEHNQPGHLNTHILDQDNDCTSKGKHARVIATYPQFENGEIEYYARVDYKWGLRQPTEEEVVEVGRRLMPKEMKGKWILRYRSGKCLGNSGHESEDFHFIRPK